MARKTWEEKVAGFWLKVAILGPDDCWLWQGCLQPEGYGKTNFSDRERGYQESMAHRIAYYLTKGYIAKGMTLDHSCENPPCVNPDHLEQKPRSKNKRRSKGRKKFCPRGHEYTPETIWYRQEPNGKRRMCGVCWKPDDECALPEGKQRRQRLRASVRTRKVDA